MQKRFFSLLFLSSVFGLAMYFISCQKESTQPENQALANTRQVTNESVARDLIPPPVTGTVSSICSCSTQQCNTIGPPTSGNQFNGIKIALDPLTYNYYCLSGGSLNYTIRQGNSCTSGPIVASFSCSNSTVYFVSPTLPNNTLYSVQISSSFRVSPCYPVTTSNCRSLPCDISQ